MPTKSDSPRQTRGSSVVVEKAFLDYLHSRWREVKRGEDPRCNGEPTSMERFGHMLAEATGREEPWSKATLSRFLAGDRVTAEVLQDLLSFFDIPSPLLSAKSIEEIEWFQLGRELLENDKADFYLLKNNALARVRTIREKRMLDQALASNPDD